MGGEGEGESTVYELIPLKAIAPGQELTLDYGPLSNQELFTDFGFSVRYKQLSLLLLLLLLLLLFTVHTAVLH